MSNLLFRRFMMSNTQNSGGGGDSGGEEDANAPVTFTINVTNYTSDGIEGYIEFSKPLPYDIFVKASDDYNGESVRFNIPVGTTYYDFYYSDRVWDNLDQPIPVVYFEPYDINYRIIPTHIEAVLMPGHTIFNTGLGQYLYTSNINYLPVSEDDIGSNSEVCPIIDLGDLKNTDQNVIWYNYNEEILFRDTYSDTIYALNSNGVLYKYN